MSQSDSQSAPTAVATPVEVKPSVQAGWTGPDYDFVNECWDQVRPAKLYELYFGTEVDYAKKLNLAMEIIVAVTASSGAIFGWAMWTVPAGAWVWTALAGIAAVVSVIKPIIRLDLKIERYSKLLSEYRGLSDAYRAIIFSIQQSQQIKSDSRMLS